jgi:two-component system OmpR family sensor kinase
LSNEELRASIEALEADISALCDNTATRLSTSNRPAPLAGIADSINRLLNDVMIQRKETELERDFIECAEHEVNNLISGARRQGEVVLAAVQGGPLEAHVRLLMEHLSRVPSFLRKIRELIHVISGPDYRDPIDLVQVCQAVIDDEFGGYTKYAGRIVFDNGECPSLTRSVDADLLTIIFGNLIRNALIHGPSDRRIVVSFGKDGVFAVMNGGPAISDCEELTDKFKRGTTNAPGSGIGLYLVDRAVKKIGGTLQLHSPARGCDSGCEVTIQFPP